MSDDIQPTVTVMMPAYNCEEYVGEAIESIINQTYTNWELICVDDESTDRTLQIMHEYAAKDPRIRVFANPENRGEAYTRNRIIQLARGRILACQDADDISLPHRLEEGTRILAAEPAIAVVASGWIEMDEQGVETGRTKPAPLLRESLQDIMAGPGVPFCHGSALMHTQAVRAIGGYDEFFEMGPDMDLFRRLAEQHKFKAVDRPWYKYRKHPGQLTATKPHLGTAYSLLSRKRLEALNTGKPFDLAAEFEKLKDEGDFEATKAKAFARAHYRLGTVRLASGKTVQARADFRAAMHNRGLVVRAFVGYTLTFVPAIIRTPAIRAYFRIKGG